MDIEGFLDTLYRIRFWTVFSSASWSEGCISQEGVQGESMLRIIYSCRAGTIYCSSLCTVSSLWQLISWMRMNCVSSLTLSDSKDLSLHRLLPLFETDKIKTVVILFWWELLYKRTALSPGQGCAFLGTMGEERKMHCGRETLFFWNWTEKHWRARDIMNVIIFNAWY